MTKTNAVRFGEFIAENNAHFEMWCKTRNYGHIDTIYGHFTLYARTARKAIAEYRKMFGFSDTEYRDWNKTYGWHYGTMCATVKI